MPLAATVCCALSIYRDEDVTNRERSIMGLVYNNGDEQFHIHVKPGEVGRYVILPGDPGRCKLIAEYLDGPKFIASNREFTTYTGSLNGTPVSVCSTGIGGPSASIALEELIKCGADTFIRIGTAGGMREDILGDDICIAMSAVRMEGTSKEYAPIEWPATADYEVVRALDKAAEELNYRHAVGVVQSKDSFYGQHDPSSMAGVPSVGEKWQSWMRLGCLCSEMETAALLTVAALRGVRCGSVLHIIANQTRREKGLEDPQVYDTDKAVRTAVEAIKILIAQDEVKAK